MTARHFLIVCLVFAAFSLPHSMPLSELFCSSGVKVCSDSLSALHSVNGYSPDNPIVIEILTQVSHLHKSGKSVVFYWVPGHTGLPGNEATDAAAKEATMHKTLISDRAVGQ
jgi:ribonuclease HI